MQVAHIATSDCAGGAALAAFRLHRDLLKLGIGSSMLVKEKTSEDRGIHEIPMRREFEPSRFQKLVNRWCIRKNRTRISNTLFSLNQRGVNLARNEVIAVADVLNLHWVAQFQSPDSIKALLDLRKPLIWTLHDQRAFTGGCHFSAGCVGYKTTCSPCPQLRIDPFSLPQRQLRHQIETLRTSLITLVCPSQWMADCARESALFRDSRIEVIPYGLDTQVFRPLPKSEARRSLNLPPTGTLILFVAHNANEKRKGFRELVQALKACATDPSVQARVRRNELGLICVGHPSKELASIGLPVMPLGFVRSEEVLNQAYAAADLFVQSSLDDNFPNTTIESMSAGTPVIAFAVGGMPEAVVDGHTGKLISRDRINGLAEGILSVLANLEAWSKLGENCREKVLREYSGTLQASRYLSLYQSLVTCRQGVSSASG